MSRAPSPDSINFPSDQPGAVQRAIDGADEQGAEQFEPEGMVA